MNDVSYKRYQFPPDIIRYAVWLYYRFTLSYRDVEELLAHLPNYNTFAVAPHLISRRSLRILRASGRQTWDDATRAA